MSIAEKLATIAENEQKIYDAGKQAEYDRFWDNYQNYGKLSGYFGSFSGYGWTTETFKPKYNISPTASAQALFQSSRIYGDLVEILDNLGIVLDTSQATNLAYTFAYSSFSRIGVIDCSNSAQTTYTFGSSASTTYLETIDEVIVKATTKYSSTFINATKLTHMIVSGTIGQNGFNVQWSPLDKASLTSIINALSTTTSGLTVTVSKKAVNKAFETSEGANDGSTSDEWLNLIATKENWSIVLSDPV